MLKKVLILILIFFIANVNCVKAQTDSEEKSQQMIILRLLNVIDKQNNTLAREIHKRKLDEINSNYLQNYQIQQNSEIAKQANNSKRNRNIIRAILWLGR